MGIKKKTYIFSMVCLIGVSVFLLNSSYLSRKSKEMFQKEEKKVVQVVSNEKLAGIGSELKDAIEQHSQEETINVINAVANNLAAGVYEEVPLGEEVSYGPEEYIVNGIDYMDYIDYSMYENVGIVRIEGSNNLNVRSGPGEEYDIVGKMTQNCGCKVVLTETAADGKTWSKISSGEVQGYVFSDYLITGSEAKSQIHSSGRLVIVANCNGLNIRKEPSLDKNVEVMTQISAGEMVDVVSIMDEWIEVQYDTSGDMQDSKAYVYKELVSVSFVLDAAVKIESYVLDANTPIRQQVVAFAQQYLGNPYVYGGTSLINGCDCSGFTLSIYKNFDINLTHKASKQATEGKGISLKDVAPGDLVFYGKSSITHVGIYIGDGLIIHAANERSDIKISNMYYSTPVKAVSVLE